LLAAEQVSADEEVAARLGLRRAGRALRVERLRTADGEPMSVELSWLPARRFPGLLRRLGRAPAQAGADAVGAVDEAVAGAYEGGLPAGEETIETVLAGPREAALLGVDVGSPLLLVCRHGWDTGGLPVEWTLAWYRGDRYKFVLSLPDGLS
jgi:GntR family transcriptional regulator